MENVVVSIFAVESEAFQAFTELRQKPVGEGYLVAEVGLLKNKDGKVSMEDAFTMKPIDSGRTKGIIIGSLAGILVDGKAVPEKDSSGRANWTAAKGSVVISLQPAYLATLPDGDHTLTAQFDDGDGVSVSFKIPAKAQPTPDKTIIPATGDGAGRGAMALSAAALASLCALAGCAARRRRED